MSIIKLEGKQITLAKELKRMSEDRQDYADSLHKMMVAFVEGQKIEVEAIQKELAFDLGMSIEESRTYEFIEDLMPWGIIYLKKANMMDNFPWFSIVPEDNS